MVLATEKKQKSVLYDEHSINKVEPITKNIGIVYSGMGPDYRWVSLWVYCMGECHCGWLDGCHERVCHCGGVDFTACVCMSTRK